MLEAGLLGIDQFDRRFTFIDHSLWRVIWPSHRDRGKWRLPGPKISWRPLRGRSHFKSPSSSSKISWDSDTWIPFRLVYDNLTEVENGWKMAIFWKGTALEESTSKPSGGTSDERLVDVLYHVLHLRCVAPRVLWIENGDGTIQTPSQLRWNLSCQEPTSHNLLAKIACEKCVICCLESCKRSCVWLLPITPKNWHLRCFSNFSPGNDVNPSLRKFPVMRTFDFPYWFKDFQREAAIWRYRRYGPVDFSDDFFWVLYLSQLSSTVSSVEGVFWELCGWAMPLCDVPVQMAPNLTGKPWRFGCSPYAAKENHREKVSLSFKSKGDSQVQGSCIFLKA